MNKHSNIFSIFLLLIAACVLTGWADTWEQIRQGAGKIQSVRAEFVQEKHMKILSKPLVSEGVLYYQVPNSLRWEYARPIQSILLMHSGKMKRYVRKGDGYIQDAGASLQAMQIVMQEITRWLNGRFDENPDFKATLETGRKIVLSPQNESLAMMIQRIELILSDQPGIIQRVMIYESKDSFTKLEFRNTELNQKLETSLFLEI